MDNIAFKGVETRTQLLAFLSLKSDLSNISEIISSENRYSSAQIIRSINLKTMEVKTRKISIPSENLKALQSICTKELEKLYSPPDSSCAYIKGRGIVSNATPHVGKRWVLKIDISDFYDSITRGRIRGLFAKLLPNKQPEFYDLLTEVITFEGVLPTGAPSSPLVSNMIMLGLDRSLERIARKK